MFCERIIEKYKEFRGQCCSNCHDESEGFGGFIDTLTIDNERIFICCRLYNLMVTQGLIKETNNGN